MALLWRPPRAKENWISQQRLYSLFIKFQPTAENHSIFFLGGGVVEPMKWFKKAFWVEKSTELKVYSFVLLRKSPVVRAF